MRKIRGRRSEYGGRKKNSGPLGFDLASVTDPNQ
jgi:hypothetical protein